MIADSFGRRGKELVPDADGMTRSAGIVLLLDNNCLTSVTPEYSTRTLSPSFVVELSPYNTSGPRYKCG